MPVNQASEKTSMASIGEKLKTAREKRGFAIDQAHLQTHIHPTVLSALEEGRCDEILTPTYVKSFLKKYSNYLGLDTKEILSEYGAIHPETPNISRKTESNEGANTFSYTRIIKPLLILLGATLFIFLLGNLVANYIRAPKKAASSASYRGKDAVKGKRPAGKAGRTADVSAKKESLNSVMQDKILIFQDPIPKTAPLNLTIKVKQQVLVQLKKDGVILYKRVLPKGSVETLSASDMINLFAAKVEAIELTLNGRPLNIDKKGQVKDLEITRRGLRLK